VFRGGIVAYANAVKAGQLGVPEDLLQAHGAVSEPVARAMAEGVRLRLGTDFGVSTSGVAGPTGGTPDKPVGTVCIAVAGPDGVEGHSFRFPGDREWVRERSCLKALDLLRHRVLGTAGG